MDMNAIYHLVVAVVIVGGLVYLMNLAPLDATIKKIGTVLILVVAVLWALRWLMGLAR